MAARAERSGWLADGGLWHDGASEPCPKRMLTDMAEESPKANDAAQASQAAPGEVGHGAFDSAGQPAAADDAVAHVEFEGVSKSYDGAQQVVRNLQLVVRRGEFLTLLGPSGSGKTTCLMMLAGFEAPTAGAIRIDGRAVEDLPPRKRNIGMVFQNYALFPHMTVGANLSFPLEVRGLGEAERAERVRRALQLVRLEGLEGRKPGALSGGQQQRVAIARALVFEPSLVLMDEPLGALDRRLREEMQYEILRIQRTLGITVVYVTHDQQEAMVMSNRVAVFNQGRIQQIAPPEALYEEPERPFVATFIGENNLLHGRLAAIDGNICQVDTGDGLVHAYRVTSGKPGDAVTVAVRPERVGLASRAGHYSNEFEAHIENMSFLGDHLRLRASVCGSSSFMIKIPNIVGHGPALKGDRVRIGWATMDCRALDLDEEQA